MRTRWAVMILSFESDSHSVSRDFRKTNKETVRVCYNVGKFSLWEVKTTGFDSSRSSQSQKDSTTFRIHLQIILIFISNQSLCCKYQSKMRDLISKIQLSNETLATTVTALLRPLQYTAATFPTHHAHFLAGTPIQSRLSSAPYWRLPIPSASYS